METVVKARSSFRGQALAELVIILPLLLALAGIVVDFGRAYAVRVALESATRNAAEYVASSATSPAEAAAWARRIICLETASVAGHVAGADPATCTQPEVNVESFSRSSTAPGATSFHPIGSVTIEASIPFAMLVRYPWLGEDGWTVSARSSFEVAQKR